jgi:hypothetical protein
VCVCVCALCKIYTEDTKNGVRHAAQHATQQFWFVDRVFGIVSVDQGLQTFLSKGPHPLLWAGSWTARGHVRTSGISNRLHYCVIFIIYT